MRYNTLSHLVIKANKLASENKPQEAIRTILNTNLQGSDIAVVNGALCEVLTNKLNSDLDLYQKPNLPKRNGRYVEKLSNGKCKKLVKNDIYDITNYIKFNHMLTL